MYSLYLLCFFVVANIFHIFYFASHWLYRSVCLHFRTVYICIVFASFYLPKSGKHTNIHAYKHTHIHTYAHRLLFTFKWPSTTRPLMSSTQILFRLLFIAQTPIRQYAYMYIYICVSVYVDLCSSIYLYLYAPCWFSQFLWTVCSKWTRLVFNHSQPTVVPYFILHSIFHFVLNELLFLYLWYISQ